MTEDFVFSFSDDVFFSGVGKMFFTFELSLDADVFDVFEADAVATAVSLFSLQIIMGSATDESEDSVALVAATVAAVVVVVREEGSIRDEGIKFCSGTISEGQCTIPLHSNLQQHVQLKKICFTHRKILHKTLLL